MIIEHWREMINKSGFDVSGSNLRDDFSRMALPACGILIFFCIEKINR